jgi:thiol-disulfide isomerase/thioredoxin
MTNTHLKTIHRCIFGVGLIACMMMVPAAGRAQADGRQKTLDSLKEVIESRKDSLAALRRYIDILGIKDETVAMQFAAWSKQFPQSPSIPYALGEAYYKARDRRAVNSLIKVLQMQPSRDERLSKMVSVAAHERWDVDVPRTANTIDSLKKVIAANPDSLLPIQQYIFAMGSSNDTMISQVNAWIKQFPQSASIPFALGEEYYNAESPKAKPYLNKVVDLQPKNAKVWLMLAIDAERWGKNDAAREYMGKAAAADPADPSYSFYYAMDFEHVDPARWRRELYDLTKRFPNHERGAQGLYWLAYRTTDQAEKIKVFEELRTLYPPEKFSWSNSGMSGLYDAYLLQKQPGKAKDLAKAMGEKDGWPDKVSLAVNVDAIQKLAAEKKFSEAYKLLDKLKAPRYSMFVNDVALLKSNIIYESGNVQGAYDSLATLEAKAPADDVKNAMIKYGAAIGKNKEQVDEDIWRLREKFIKKAPDFNLGLYTSNKKASLSDYKGKVMLMTFWFPGCGPCRGEFPHFENVLKKFKGKDVVYVGINVSPEQDDYVLPFMQGTKYTFIPLRANAEWALKTYAVRGEPTNFLIDGDGRIVFSNFRTDANNERSLELMIASMLEKQDSKNKKLLPSKVINQQNN